MGRLINNSHLRAVTKDLDYFKPAAFLHRFREACKSTMQPCLVLQTNYPSRRAFLAKRNLIHFNLDCMINHTKAMIADPNKTGVALRHDYQFDLDILERVKAASYPMENTTDIWNTQWDDYDPQVGHANYSIKVSRERVKARYQRQLDFLNYWRSHIDYIFRDSREKIS